MTTAATEQTHHQTRDEARPRLVSVNVGRPTQIGTQHGRPVLSGIRKTSAGAAELDLSQINLTGDDQADRRAHGGPDKAVYAYPSDHLPTWERELDMELGPGAFGENLTTAGLIESDVRIGDVWSWGGAILQICQPRYPCFKLAMKLNRPDIIKHFLDSGRSGWYLRVLQPGRVSLTAPIAVIERDPVAITVLAASRAVLPGLATATELNAIIAIDALAESWRDGLRRRLDTIETTRS